MKDKNPGVATDEGVANQGITKHVCEGEVHEVLGGKKCGKVVGTDEIPMEA